MQGRDRIAQLHRGLGSIIERVTFPQVDAFAVDDELAFVEFRSDAVTKKGTPYGNYYVAKVEREGRPHHALGRVLRPEAGRDGAAGPG